MQQFVFGDISQKITTIYQISRKWVVVFTAFPQKMAFQSFANATSCFEKKTLLFYFLSNNNMVIRDDAKFAKVSVSKYTIQRNRAKY